ncbi:MAG TPA: FkbM family methyltransferase [Gemmatimonadaceae bacterium]|nr:FkbM family methyltransferase [Gemmatimonadaceae bacterium]
MSNASPERRNGQSAKTKLIAAVPTRFQMALRYWYRRAWHRLDPELRLAASLVRPGAVCIDIGANTGVYTYALARAGATVHAFEPQPGCAAAIRAFGSRRIVVHELALSDTPGALVLYVPLKPAGPETGEASLAPPTGPYATLDVEVARLDDLGVGPVSFVKIDVEGHEDRVIRGARETLRRDRPLIVCEIEQRHRSTPIRECLESFCGLGYRGYFFWEGRLRPVDRFRAEVHQIGAHRVARPRAYVNNFIFAHTDDARAGALEALVSDQGARARER